MSPKDVNKETRKLELAAVALEVFIENGFESTSMSQVASAAGIGKGTIYEYFDSKEALMLAALEVWLAALEHSSELQIDPAQSPADQLRTFTVAVTDAFLGDTRMMKSMVGMMQLFFTNEAFARLNVIEAMSRDFRAKVVEILLEGISTGQFKREIAPQAEKIALNLFGYLDGIGLHYMASGVGGTPFFDIQEQVENYLDLLLTAIETDRE